MKSNLLRKAKWYVLGVILIATMLAVSLSFCSWDNLSLSAKLSGGSGGFKEKYALADDKNNNKVADVGDIVTFGSYYQDIDSKGELLPKTPIRWIVVDKIDGVLTLYSEKILAYGSFFGTWYVISDTERVFGVNQYRNQNYSVSNVRYWLNSYETPRGDGGISFSPKATGRVTFKGFYSEAFNDYEKSLIQNRRIWGMAGNGLYQNEKVEPVAQYAECNDKVWIPSSSEIAGSNAINWVGDKSDGYPNAQFEYFKNYQEGAIKRTAFSYSKHSNYTHSEITHYGNFAENSVWLRSPSTKGTNYVIINCWGIKNGYDSADSYHGIRPAICISATK